MKKSLLVLALSFSGWFGGQVGLAATIEPDVEIKYDIQAKFADESLLTKTFQATKTDTYQAYFVDTPATDFYQDEFIQRVRFYQGEDTFDVTYKKRFSSLSVSEAIAQLEDHGFTGDEANYKFEIDQLNQADVMSVSRKEKVATTTDLTYGSVDSTQLLAVVADQIPKKLKKWNSASWYETTMKQAHLYGPAEAVKYEGTYAGIAVELEVWHYQGKQIVELSTKTTQAEAPSVSQTLKEQLVADGNLSETQQGKTNFVLFP